VAGLTWSLVRIARLRRSMAALAMDARDVAQGNARQPLALDADARVTDLRAALTEMGQALGADIAVAEAEHAQLAAIPETVTDLQRADTVRREFVANVSHELRTPVASLKAMAETLANGALDDAAAARSFVDRMLVETDRLAQLVEELLELARLEGGRAIERR